MQSSARREGKGRGAHGGHVEQLSGLGGGSESTVRRRRSSVPEEEDEDDDDDAVAPSTNGLE